MKTILIGVLVIAAACSTATGVQPTTTKEIDVPTRGTPEALAALRLVMLRNVVLEETGDEPVLMIMDMPDGVASLFSANNGDASIYYNKSGGAMLGSGGNPAIQAAAIRLLSEAAKHTPMMTPVSDFPLPGPDVVRFYVRTPQHVYMAEAPLDELIHDRVALSELFGAGMDVLLPLSKLEDDIKAAGPGNPKE